MSDPAIPVDGPGAALVYVMRRLRLPYSQNSVIRAVAAHPRPSSLLALVEVARGLGLEIKPYRAEPSAFDGLVPPMIVHFGEGDSGGFAVVEAVSEDGFRVWDSAAGSRVLDRDTFLEHWSGVVAVVEHDPRRTVGAVRYLRHRLSDVLWGSLSSPTVMTGRAAPVVRAVLGVLGVALLVWAVAARPSADRPAALGLVVLATIGLAVTAAMAASMGSPLASRLCGRGRLVDCETVLTSRYARIAGIPLGDVGMSFYGAVLLLMGTAGIPRASAVWSVVGLAYLASVPASVLLVAVQVSMRRLCMLCLAVHAVNMGGAAVAVLGLRLGWPTSAEVPGILLFALFFLLLLFSAVPYLRASQALATLVRKQSRMSASPFSALADVLTEAPTDVRGPECGVGLHPSPAAHELVVFAHPSCKGCGPVLREAEAIAHSGRVGVFVALAPRVADDRDRRLCAAISAAGVGLGPGALLRAYTAAKEHLERALGEDPVQVLADELSVAPAAIEAGLERARSLVARAEGLADEHVEGTPAVFFDSRPHEGPLSHLAFLVEHHPELLEPIQTPEARTAPA